MRMFTYADFAASIALPSFGAGRSPATPQARSFRLKALGLGIALLAVLAGLALVVWPWMAGRSWVQIATAWGLPGVWQQDCEAPVSLDNPRYKYSIEEGKILLRRDFGGRTSDASEITDVDLTPAGELGYMVHFVQLGKSRKDQVSRQNVLAKAADGRIRTVSNKQASSGEASVVGGVRAADQNPTPWMSRCRPE
jgi:hypothetical protein